MGVAKDVYEIIKELKGMVKEYHNEEMSEKVVDIQDSFFELREEIETVKEENRGLKAKIKLLEDSSKLEKDLEMTPMGLYVRISEKEQGKTMEYCPACWQNHKKLFPIVRTIGNARQCCNCHSVFR